MITLVFYHPVIHLQSTVPSHSCEKILFIYLPRYILISFFVDTSCDEGFKAAARLVDAASPQNTAGLPAGSLAFNVPIPLFKWIASTPENAWRAERQLQTYNQLHHIANHGLEEGMSLVASLTQTYIPIQTLIGLR